MHTLKHLCTSSETNKMLKSSTFCLFILLIFCIARTTLCCSPLLAKQGTAIAKDSGLSGAGERCNNNGTCGELLQCNQVPEKNSYPLRHKPVCQVQSWLIGISLTLMILIPILLIAIIFYCCQKHHCFSRLVYSLTKRDSQISRGIPLWIFLVFDFVKKEWNNDFSWKFDKTWFMIKRTK